MTLYVITVIMVCAVVWLMEIIYKDQQTSTYKYEIFRQTYNMDYRRLPIDIYEYEYYSDFKVNGKQI